MNPVIPYMVMTLAGQVGAGGNVDGVGAAAHFAVPGAVCVDGSGNAYIADPVAETIRKVTPAGVVTTLAGQPAQKGEVDGVRGAARFNFPAGITIDRAGNVYVLDEGEGTAIRKVAPDGTVTTVLPLSASNPNAQAQVHDGIARDSAGNIYFTLGRRAVFELAASGGITQIGTYPAGQRNPPDLDGTRATASFAGPSDLAMAPDGTLYVADTTSIRRIGTDGSVTTVAKGVAQDGPRGIGGTDAAAITVDGQGNVFVIDGLTCLREVTPAGQVSTLAGRWEANGVTEGIGPVAGLGGTIALAVDGAGRITLVGGSVVSVASPFPAAPQIVFGPLPQTTVAAGKATFTVTAVGATGYQWYHSGAALIEAPGAGSGPYPYYMGPNTPTLELFQAKEGNYDIDGSNGLYTVVASNAAGSVEYEVQLGVVDAGTPPSRLVNLSANAQVGAGGANPLVAGFYVAGSGSKPVLARGVGPALASFGVTGPLPAPQLTWYSANGAVVGSNAGWGGADALRQAFNLTGAFALPSGSADAALIETVPIGAGTVQVGSAPGAPGGVALAELYDDDASPLSAPARLANLSARALVTPGHPLTAGFSIEGSLSKTVVLRAIGPALGGFGVANPLQVPQLVLYTSAGDQIGLTNLGWSPGLASAFAIAGAFPLPAGSADAAIEVSLNPGTYTFQVVGADGGQGTALAEIYELP